MTRVVPVLVVLNACVGAPVADGAGFVAPLDGQTRVPPNLDLLVVAPDLSLPPDQPVDPDTIEVIDLYAGTVMPGEIARDGVEIRFHPHADWVPGHTYLWSVRQVPPAARNAHQVLPESLIGEATFRAADGNAVLDAAIDDDGAVCLLLSRALDDVPPELELTLDDAPVVPSWEVHAELDALDGVTLIEGDPGASVACWTNPPELSGGESLRAWWGDDGPWRFTLRFGPRAELSREERRWVGR